MSAAARGSVIHNVVTRVFSYLQLSSSKFDILGTFFPWWRRLGFPSSRSLDPTLVPFSPGGICTCDNVEEAEGTVLLVGLNELEKWFNRAIINELDCLTLVQALKPETANKSRLFSVVCNIKEALKHLKSHQITWICTDRTSLHTILLRGPEDQGISSV